MKRQDYTKLQTRKMKGLKRKSDTSETQGTKNKVKKKNQINKGFKLYLFIETAEMFHGEKCKVTVTGI